MKYCLIILLMATSLMAQPWGGEYNYGPGQNLADIVYMTPTNGVFIVGDGSNFVSESGDTARISLGVGTTDSPTFAGLTIGSSELDVTGVSTNDVLKYNGTKFVVTPYTTDFSFDVSTFTDNITSPVLLGSGQWLAIGGATFGATYQNGPPTSAIVTLSGDFDDSTTGWSSDQFDMSGDPCSLATTEVTNYPDDSGDVATFTMTADGDSDLFTSATFYNYLIYDDYASNSGFNDADLDSIASGGTQSITNDHTDVTITQAAIGASNYMVFAHRTGDTQPVQVYCGTGADQITAAFYVGTATNSTLLTETVSHSNAAGNAKTENFYVYASISQNLDAHSTSFTLSSSSTVQNYQRWGLRDDTSWVDAEILALTNAGFANSTDNSRSDFGNLTPAAGNYVIYACPTRESDLAHATAFRFDGVTAAFENDATVAVTNEAGYQENYRVYRSTITDMGIDAGELETDGGATVLNYFYLGGTTISTGWTEGNIEDDLTDPIEMITNDEEQVWDTVTLGINEYYIFAMPSRLTTPSFYDNTTTLGADFEAAEQVNLTNHGGYLEEYDVFRSTNALGGPAGGDFTLETK